MGFQKEILLFEGLDIVQVLNKSSMWSLGVLIPQFRFLSGLRMEPLKEGKQ